MIIEPAQESDAAAVAQLDVRRPADEPRADYADEVYQLLLNACRDWLEKRKEGILILAAPRAEGGVGWLQLKHVRELHASDFTRDPGDDGRPRPVQAARRVW